MTAPLRGGAPRVTLRARAPRLLVAASLVALAVGVSHATAPQAAATDCITYYCSRMTVAFTGNGSAHVVDNQGEIDCYGNASSNSGTCTIQYYWIGQSSNTLHVVLTATATANSWVWSTAGSSQPGGSVAITFDLQRDTETTITYAANLAKTLAVTVSNPGDGSGSIISDPAGIDCDIAGSATTGLCSHIWYFIDSVVVTFYGAPSAGSYICGTLFVPPTCQPVGQPDQSVISESTSTTDPTFLAFRKGHPILSASVDGQGNVFSDPPGISCPNSCSSYFPPSTHLSVNAAAKAGYVFSHWSGACANQGPTCSLTLGTTDVSTTATFALPATPVPTRRPTPIPSSPTSTTHASPSTPGAASIAPVGSPELVTADPSASWTPGPVAVGNSATGLTHTPDAGTGAGSTGPGSGSGSGVDLGLLALIVLLILVLGVAIAVGTMAAASRRRRSKDDQSSENAV